MLTFPSLQGTLVKHTKPMLQSNFTTDPFRPSRSNVDPGENIKPVRYKD